jgi:hypothetical protein
MDRLKTAPQAGLEPATLRLTEDAVANHGVTCSTIEVTECARLIARISIAIESL